ncbi:MAG: 3-keto-5-aminohexanoate cleavage protein, partial [Gammaproteobacteria bacterium]|nr:3-keto-5-aminohexanoate cleavage protein [Gammaproteobacteria bacterium]
DTVARSDKVPVTPAAIAAACVEAARAGAAIAHEHVRDPRTGQGSRELALYREVIERVRDSGTDVILNLTTGMGGDYVPDESDPARAGPGSDLVPPAVRLAHIEALLPELCSLDCGTMNFGTSVFMNTPAHLEQMAARIRELRVKPELEVFELGHIRFARELMARGLIEPPPLFQLCLGIPWGAPADLRTLMAMHEALPHEALWSAFGIGREQFPMVAQAVLLGGHVRVGLEDNLYLARGQLATNAELVARAVELIGRLGRSVVSGARAREILRLRPRRQAEAPAPGADATPMR